MALFNYATIENDRIDNLAQMFYGGMHGISILANANPLVPMYPVFPIGTSLVVPIIEPEVVSTNNNLPPWKGDSLSSVEQIQPDEIWRWSVLNDSYLGIFSDENNRIIVLI